jgi:hypothetical protein
MSIALRYASGCHFSVPIDPMRTVEETRRLRLIELRDTRADGNLARLARLADMGARDSTFSQIINRSIGTKTNKPKTMGSEQARKLEAVFKLPAGWMDTDPDAWPFKDIDRTRFDRLSERHRLEIQGAVRTLLIEYESESGKSSTSTDDDDRVPRVA